MIIRVYKYIFIYRVKKENLGSQGFKGHLERMLLYPLMSSNVSSQKCCIYSRTSVARTLMARLPRLFRTRS